MANRYRGDVDLALESGTLTLRFTLGALAEIEQAFAATDLSDLGMRLQKGRLASADLIRLLGAAVRGGGQRMSDQDFAARVSATEIPICITALAHLLSLTFGADP